MQQLVHQHLLRAQNKMKHHADHKRTFREFSASDSVYVKLQPYVQTSIATRSSNKLAFRYFGPYVNTDKIGSVAYRLALPATSSIHPVFHVSQLKHAVAPHHQVHSELPNPDSQLQIPIQILDRRLHRYMTHTTPQVLVQWYHLPVPLSTWEDEDALRQAYPRAPAWGQAVSQGGEDVTNHGRTAPVEAGEEHSETEDRGTEERGRAKRMLKPKRKVAGPEWM